MHVDNEINCLPEHRVVAFYNRLGANIARNL